MEDPLTIRILRQKDNMPLIKTLRREDVLAHSFNPKMEVGRYTFNLDHTLCWKPIVDQWKKEGFVLSLFVLTCQHVHFFTSMEAYVFGIPAYSGDQLGHPVSRD